MIPEATSTKSIRLYEAIRYPYQWRFVKTLLTGPRFVDNTIFEHEGSWYLFTETGDCDVLSLYYADSPLGPWTEHPKSPIINGNPNYARPGGNIISVEGRLFRFTQDDEPSYGNQIWAFEIQKLTRTEYVEHRFGRGPFLKGNKKWNRNGVHQLSACQHPDGGWIAAIDGF